MFSKKGVLAGIFLQLFFMSMGLLQGQPASFDWRDYGMVTSVKNQGGSGSAWAFAVAGSYESAILIDGGPSENLSEQYLQDSYPTFNFDWGMGMTEGIPREESYSAGGLADLPVCFKCYPASAWYFVGDSGTVPTTAALKQAIYNYGPVCAAVYASPAFQLYAGGIFNRFENGTVNHCIVLVGWNDTGGYWILKNSWGTSWGESGYMRIAYGSNQVGYAAAYWVVADHRCISPGRWYKFINRRSGNAMDVNSGSYYVYQFPYDGGTDKQWSIAAVGSGWVKIVNRYSTYALDVNTTGNYVYQYPYVNSTDKHWDVIYHHNGYYKVNNRYNGNSLSIGASSYVYHYPWNGNADKQWQIIEVTGSDAVSKEL